MNLNHEELEELNALLADKSLDLPGLRRKVNSHGMNYHWLQRNIQIRNKNLAPRLVELLHLRTFHHHIADPAKEEFGQAKVHP